MGVIIRQSIKNTVILYVGIIFGFVSTILLFPRILTPAQYGLTRLLFSLSMVCIQFAHLGTKNIIIRFFPYFRDSRESRGRFFSAILLISFFGFLLFTAIYLLFKGRFLVYYSDNSPLFTQYYLFLIPMVFGILFFEVINNYIRALHDAVTGSFVHEVLLRALIIVMLVVYYYQLIPFVTFMIGFVGCYVLQPIFLLVSLYWRGDLTLSTPILQKRSKFLQGMGVYGGYSLLGGLTTLLVSNIDIIMLGAMMNLSNTAVYAIAFYVGSVIAVPQRSILKIATPVLAGLLKEKKYDEISSLYKRTSLNQIIAGSLLYIGIWANLHNLMDLLPAAYQGAQHIILVIGFAKLFDMATGINGGIILNSKYFRFNLYVNIFLVILAISANYILIPIYGILGAAIATTLSIVVYNTIKLVFVWVKFSMQPFEWNTPVVIAIAAACLILSFQIPYLVNLFVDVIVRSLSITIVFIGTILLFGLSEDVKSLVREIRRRTKLFLSP